MLFFSILVSVIGFFSALRTLKSVFGDNLIRKSELTKFGTASFLLFAWLTYFRIPFAAQIFTTIVALLFLRVVLPIWARRRRERLFRENICNFLLEAALSVRSGNSFRSAIEIAARKFSEPTLQMTAQIPAAVAFAQAPLSGRQASFVEFVVTELRRIDQAGHQALERLSHLRLRFKTEDDFARQSKQVTMQVRFQIIILGLLFIAMQVGAHFMFPDSMPVTIQIYANLMFVIGIYLQHLLARKTKWNT